MASSAIVDSSRRSMNIVDDTDGPLDPRIQIELEKLNNATDDINKLEIELDEANTAYGQLLSESTSLLKELMNKLGSSCIDKARCYFEACEIAHEANVKCQKQAQLYQSANNIHATAKETVSVAEKNFFSHQHEWNFDQAWQDMFNHATLKVMEAENQKAECAREHHKWTVLFHEAEKKVQQLEEKYRRSIQKAKPYFDLKAQCDQRLAMQKEAVECLKNAVKDAKCSYAASLRALEEISNQIHEKRRDYDIVANGPREPGVGAELVTPEQSLNYQDELNKVQLSRVNSVASSETDYDRNQDFEDIRDLKQRVDHLSSRAADGSESNSSQWELELQASVEKLNKLPFAVNKSEKSDSRSTKVLKAQQKNENADVDGNFVKNEEFKNEQQLNDTHHSWQSLTQSPINSFISRSKLVFKNSFSKSLTSSPAVVGAASLGKSKSLDSETDSHDCSSVLQDGSSVHQGEKETFVDPTEETQTIENLCEASCSSNQRNENKDLESANLQVQNKFKETRSVDSTPVRRRGLFTSNFTHSLINGLNNNNKVEQDHKDSQSDRNSSKSKELPLLSFFQKSSHLIPPKDKSCSMINLNEKENLKTVLDNSTLNTIQTVSIEKLANVRPKLIGES